MVPNAAVQGAPGAAAVDLEYAAIRLTPHDPEWGVCFEAERVLLVDAIGEWAVGGIHHVGSTAIPGVDAEPVIDILVGTLDPPGSQACVAPIAKLGYLPNASTDGEARAFCKLEPERPAFELTLLPSDAARFSEMLAFRELLRSNRQVAIGYAGMKRDLAGRNAADRDGYASAKAELIRAVLGRL
jgi:GrpB-like predicted nucleotidyltransferase (UPF0157 family)